MLHITRNIKTIREKLKLSQAQMAGKLDVKRSTYAEWERETIPQADIIVRISELAGISCDEILSEAGEFSINGQKPKQNKKISTSPDYQIGVLTGKLETKDEVIMAKDQTIEVQKEFMDLLKTNLGSLSDGQQRIYSWIRSGILYHVAKINAGNKKMEAADLGSLDKMLEDSLKIDLKSDKAASARK